MSNEEQTLNVAFVRRKDPDRPGHYFPVIGDCKPEDYVDLPWHTMIQLNSDDIVYIAKQLQLVEAKKNDSIPLG